MQVILMCIAAGSHTESNGCARVVAGCECEQAAVALPSSHLPA